MDELSTGLWIFMFLHSLDHLVEVANVGFGEE
jgi:hypothetical protein